MLRVGITGGIGSGKTSVADSFAELGVPVIDSDVIARLLLVPGEDAYKQVVDKFGESIVLEDRSIDRSRLRDLVFSDKNNRELIENILHPEVRKKITSDVSKLQSPYCIVVVPLLIETDFINLVDRILVVDADEDIRINRVMERDNMSRKDVVKIINSQSTNQAKLEVADDILDNNSNKKAIAQQVGELHKKYLSLSDKLP